MATTLPAGTPPYTAAAVGTANAASTAVNTPEDFANALLNYMGLPTTASNVQAIVAWEAAEGGNWNNTATYNPLNTTLAMPGSKGIPTGTSSGGSFTETQDNVQAFTSWQQGIEATAQTLRGGRYSAIIAALQAGNNAGAVVQAVVNSPWGTQSIDLGSAAQYSSTTGTPGSGGVYSTSGSQVDHPYDPNDPNLQNPTPQEMTWIKQNMGQYMWMMGDPELSKILMWAGYYQITDGNEIQSLVSQTDWYKTHSQAQQQWIQTYAQGSPGNGMPSPTAQKAIHDAAMSIQQEAGKLGVQMTPDQINTLAVDINYYGLSQAEIDAAIGQYSSTAAPSDTLAQLQQSVNQYLVSVPNSTLQQWLTGINSGTMTQANVDASLKQLAAGKYPWMAQQIQAGMTPQAILAPYQSEIGSALQIDPSTINFNDTKWASLVSNTDPKTGMQVQTPLWQSIQQVKQNPNYGYQNTPDAKNAAYDTASQLSTLMGKVAP